MAMRDTDVEIEVKAFQEERFYSVSLEVLQPLTLYELPANYAAMEPMFG